MNRLPATIFLVMLLAVPVMAVEQKFTNPLMTCGVMGQMVQNAALALGPIRGTETIRNPYQQHAVTHQTTQQATVVNGSGPKTTTKTIAKMQKAADTPTASPQVYKFTGKQMWGDAEVTIIPNDGGFIVKAKATLPVSMWTMFADDAVVATSKTGNQTAFTFTIREPYNPPYTLTLNVTYMGMPNQIKVEIK